MQLEQLLSEDPVLHEHIRDLVRRRGVDRAAIWLSRELSGLRAPGGVWYSLGNLKHAVHAMHIKGGE